MTPHTQAVRDAYDQFAPDYDADFTDSRIGRIQRAALWRRFDALFQPGQRVLDLGCGTGEDALHFAGRGIRVHGIDVSPAMTEIADRRTANEDRVTLQTLSLERLSRLDDGPFDGTFSSFGPINCVRDLPALARDLAPLVKPGGAVALCLMNRRCLWETLLYPLAARLHGRAAAGETWSDEHSADEGFRAFYPSVDEVRRAFAPWFGFRSAPGVGLFVPPTYLEPIAADYPRVMRLLARADRFTAHLPMLRRFADNRLVILRRQNGR